MDLTPTELEALRASLPEKDRHRLRPDGLLEPELPPLHLCGGLEKPYLVESSDSASPSELSASDRPPSSASE